MTLKMPFFVDCCALAQNFDDTVVPRYDAVQFSQPRSFGSAILHVLAMYERTLCSKGFQICRVETLNFEGVFQ